MLGAFVKVFVFFTISVCADLIRGAKEKNLKVKGPVRMPTKVLKYNHCNGFLIGFSSIEKVTNVLYTQTFMNNAGKDRQFLTLNSLCNFP